MAEDFFTRFATLVAGAAAPPVAATTGPTEAPAPAEAPAAAIPPPQPARAGLKPTVWIPLLAAVVLIILLIFGLR